MCWRFLLRRGLSEVVKLVKIMRVHTQRYYQGERVNKQAPTGHSVLNVIKKKGFET